MREREGKRGRADKRGNGGNREIKREVKVKRLRQ